MERAEDARREQRSDAGTIRATERDVVALTWVVEMYAMPLDLLGRLTGATPGALRQMTHRWRKAGWVETARLGAGPSWVYATSAGVTQFGRHPYAVNVPSAARLRHIRAAIVTRMDVEATNAALAPEWRSERELRWEIGQRRGADAARGHVPDAELETTNPEGGRPRWAVEVELTPKALDRTVMIMRQLLNEGISGDGYVRVLYVVSPEARPIVERAREALGPKAVERIMISNLPAGV